MYFPVGAFLSVVLLLKGMSEGKELSGEGGWRGGKGELKHFLNLIFKEKLCTWFHVPSVCSVVCGNDKCEQWKQKLL